MSEMFHTPVDVSAEIHNSAVFLKWEYGGRADGYILRFYTTADPERCVKKRYAQKKERFVDGLINGTEYTVTVTAFLNTEDGEQEGEPSQGCVFTPNCDHLTATNVICISKGEFANIKWERSGETPMARFVSDNPDVAQVDYGLVRGISKGSANIKTIAKGQSFTTRVYVDREQPPVDTTAVMLFSGDIMCTAAQQRRAVKTGFDFSPSFTGIKELLSSADLCCGSLGAACYDGAPYEYEQPRTADGAHNCNAPSTFVSALSGAGFDMLVTANDHCCRIGDKAAEETVSEIKRAGVDNIGTFGDNPVFRRVKGFRVAIIAYSMIGEKNGIAAYDRAQVKALCERSRKSGAEFIIVYMHWGVTNSKTPADEQIEEARYIAECGADLIIGCHSHVVQELRYIETESGRKVPCAFSLGNFITAQNDFAENSDGVLLRVELVHADGAPEARLSYVPCMSAESGGVLRSLPLIRISGTEAQESLERTVGQIGAEISPFGIQPKVVLSGSVPLSRVFGHGDFTMAKASLKLSQLSACTGTRITVGGALNSLRLDMEKCFGDYIKNSGAEYIAIDLYTAATTPLYRRGDALYSGTQRFFSSDFYLEHTAEFQRISPPFPDKIWKSCLKKYAEAVLTAFPHEKIILFRQRLSDKSVMGGSELRRVSVNEKIAEQLTEMEDYFISLTDPCVIDISGNYFSTENAANVMEQEYYQDAYNAAMRIIDGGRRCIITPDLEIWYDRVLKYYDSMTANSYQRWLLDMRCSADMIIAYTNAAFAAKYRSSLLRLKGCGESQLDWVGEFFFDDSTAAEICEAAEIIYAVLMGDVSQSYDFYAPAFRHNMNIVKLIAKLLSMQTGAPVSAKNAELVMLLRDKPNELNSYIASLPAVTVDIWGSELSKEILNRCSDVEVGKYIFLQNPILSYEPLMPVQIPADVMMFGGNHWRRRSAEEAFSRSGMFTLSKSGSKWLVMDLYDIVCEMNEYKECLFEVDDFFRATDFYKSIAEECTSCFMYEKRSLNACREALMRFTKDIAFRYQKNIILVRVDLKDKYIGLDDRVEQLSVDPKLDFKRKFITACEDLFIQLTGCYVIDMAKHYYSSDAYPKGGASSSHYEEEFYIRAAQSISEIVRGGTSRLYDSVDSRYLTLRDMRLNRE